MSVNATGPVNEDFVLRSKANAIARRVKLADTEVNMDVRRLSVVTETDKARLEKYRKANAVLTKNHTKPLAED